MTISIYDGRRIIFPIDGAADPADMVKQAISLFSHEDALPWVGMIKLNDGVHIPGMGPDIIAYLREAVPGHVGFFLDLKIFDVSATMANTLKRYAEYEPEIVTVCSKVTVKGLLAIRETLPNTKIAIVDTLTDMPERECRSRYGTIPAIQIANAIIGLEKELRLVSEASPIDLIVCSANDLSYLRERFGARYGFVCPGIRDEWMFKGGNEDHQRRVAGTCEALRNGATYIVMGTQLTKGNPKAGISPEESRGWTWAEMKRYSDEREVKNEF